MKEERYYIKIERYNDHIERGLQGHLTDRDLAIQIVLNTVWHTDVDFVQVKRVVLSDREGNEILAYKPPLGVYRA